MNTIPKWFLPVIPLVLAALPYSVSAQQLSGYEKMRIEFSTRAEFNPYMYQMLERRQVDQAMEQWEAKKAKDAFDLFYDLLQVYPVSLEAHRRLADGYQILIESADDEKQKEYYIKSEKKHRDTFDGLLKSITNGRSGKNPDSAFPVITFAEEIWVLRSLGLTPFERKTNVESGHAIYGATDPDGGEHKLYFDISRVLAKDAQKPSA